MVIDMPARTSPAGMLRRRFTGGGCKRLSFGKQLVNILPVATRTNTL